MLSLQHIHVLSTDKKALARWYCENLGFEILDDLEERGEPNGPILITSDQGQTSVSIFTKAEKRENILPAYGTDLEGFLRFHQKFQRPQIYDHYRFFSIYIPDLDANRIEICCWEYEKLKARLDVDRTAYVLMTPETYSAK